MRKTCRKYSGFSLMESLLLTIILGIVGSAAGAMLLSLAKSPRDTETQYQLETALVSKMESVRAIAFDSLEVGGSLSDSVTIGGKSYSRSVEVALADANGDGSPESNFKSITVSVGGQSVTTLVNRP